MGKLLMSFSYTRKHEMDGVTTRASHRAGPAACLLSEEIGVRLPNSSISMQKLHLTCYLGKDGYNKSSINFRSKLAGGFLSVGSIRL
jgi:hypothetical protein